MSDKKLVPKDLRARGRGVLALAAKVAGHELRHRVRSTFRGKGDDSGSSELLTRIEQARAMVESLGRMKGALMKAGQLLSIDAGEWLPKEAIDVLAKLQGQSEPMDFAIIRQVIEEDLGDAAPTLLRDLDPVPAAAASMGQVHRAFVSRPVAVKVQYPGIADSIDSDIESLAKLSGSMVALSRKSIDMAGLLGELRDVLHNEVDYARERMYLERFRGLVSGDHRFVVPESVPELSSGRVLTMSWEDGVPLGEWLRQDPTRAQSTEIAKHLLDLYCLEFFRWGVVQTDPNFGNFLVRADGRIVLLDFGATVEYDDAFRTAYVSLLRAIGKGDRDRALEEGIALQLLDERESPAAKELFVDMLACSAEPFEAHRQPFRFADSDYASRSRDVITRFIKSLAYTPPPKRLVFLHRKLGGLFQLLKRLDAEVDLTPYWAQMIA